jgi:hypothetical protein
MKSAPGHPVQIKFLPSIAFSVTRQRSCLDKPSKPPGKDWAQTFRKRNPLLKARTVKPIDWNRHDKYIYTRRYHTGLGSSRRCSKTRLWCRRTCIT